MIYNSGPHTIRQTLGVAVSFLSENEIDTAKNDAYVLLEHILNMDRIQLMLHMSEEIKKDKLQEYFKVLELRAQGYPLQYLVGRQEFMSLDFKVTPDVLIPRPETELLVETAIALAEQYPYPPKVVDVCTGSGCIIISICYYFKEGVYLASDISPYALEVARENALRHEMQDKIGFLEADLLDNPAFSSSDIIVSNPPYIATNEIAGLQREILGHEPHLALDGGPDGLDIYRKLIAQAYARLNQNGWLLVEIGWDQGNAVAELFLARGFNNIDIIKDYPGKDRIVKGQKGI